MNETILEALKAWAIEKGVDPSQLNDDTSDGNVSFASFYDLSGLTLS